MKNVSEIMFGWCLSFNAVYEYPEPLQKLRALSRFKLPAIFYITDRSKAVFLIWSSVFACFGVRFCTVFAFCVSR